MKLKTDIPVRQQIEAALQGDAPLVFDVRSEAMGDKAAALNVIQLLNRVIDHRAIISVVESETNARTAFNLMHYVHGAPCVIRAEDDPLEDALDLHTLGTGNESLWHLNAYAALLGVRDFVSFIDTKECSGEVVIALLEGTLYNERRDMKPGFIRVLTQLLESQGYSVTVIATAPYEGLPNIRVMSTEEAVFQISSAGCVIAGDTGFSHVAASFGRPLVGIWPDWHHFGRAKLGDAIKLSEWWQLPLYQIAHGFYPNGNPDFVRIVELGTDHAFSMDHVLRSVQSMYPLPNVDHE